MLEVEEITSPPNNTIMVGAVANTQVGLVQQAIVVVNLAVISIWGCDVHCWRAQR
jgi:hypothetical protein